MIVPDRRGYDAVMRLLGRHAGLVFPPGRRRQIELAVERGMRRARARNPHEYAGIIERDEALLGELVAELTVGETYFFREPRQFEFVGSHVVPELLARHPPGETIRVWSAGCAQGEEAYSLAILLRESGAGGRFHVLGTDISRPRLAAAIQGRYRRWSLRGVGKDVERRYFREAGGLFHLDPKIRDAAEFGYLNLAEDSYPSMSIGVWGMHIVLCRNVLIYFDAATIERVAERLLASLASDGWLFLSASDPPLAEYVECETVPTGAGIAYRRRGAGRGTAVPGVTAPSAASSRERYRFAGPDAGVEPGRAAGPEEAPAPRDVPGYELGEPGAAGPESRITAPPAGPPRELHGAAQADAGFETSASRRAPRTAELDVTDPADAVSAVRSAYAARDYDLVVDLTGRALETGDAGPEIWIARIRALANQGRLQDAGRLCAAAVERFRTDAELVYLHSVLLSAAERFADAAAAARRAVYLDRGLAVAHMAFGHNLARIDDVAGARRAYRNAERLLAHLPADSVVPLADGEPAGRLLQILRVQLRLLGDTE